MFISSRHLYVSVMSVHITAVLKEGARRTSKRNGLMLIGLVFVLSALSGLLGAGLARYAANQQFVPVEAGASALFALPPVVAGLLSFVLAIASLVVSIAAIRVFVSDETEHLSREHFTRNMGWAALNVFVGAIVFGLIVGLGLVALVIPGIFLLVTLAFWTVHVAVEDQNFVQGFRSSWALTRGHRFSLLLLGVAVVLAALAVDIVFGLGAIAGSTIGLVVAQAGSAIVTVYSTAVLAAAYTELTALPAEDDLAVEEGPVSPEDGAKTA